MATNGTLVLCVPALWLIPYVGRARQAPAPDRARFDPMITGFNPADIYAADHILHVLTTFPGVFTGIGEFSVHKEFVPAKIPGESVECSPTQMEIVDGISSDPALGHVSFDISWDEVAKYAVATPASIARVIVILEKYPDRFLFGTDTVAPKDGNAYYAVFDLWAPIWRQLSRGASVKVRTGNYEQLFDEGRRRVRAWEQAHELNRH